MRNVYLFLAAVLLASTAHGASPSPPAPQVLVVVSCRVDDLTGQPGRHGVDPVTGKYDETKAAKGWRDLELRVNPRTLEYDCKREAVPLEDAVNMHWPSKVAVPLNPDFGNPGQCGRIGMHIVAGWQESNKGWGVVAIGCPSPIGIDADGDGQPDMDEYGHYIVRDWKLPGCPSYLPGKYDPKRPENNRMKCNFDASAV